MSFLFIAATLHISQATLKTLPEQSKLPKSVFKSYEKVTFQKQVTKKIYWQRDKNQLQKAKVEGHTARNLESTSNQKYKGSVGENKQTKSTNQPKFDISLRLSQFDPSLPPALLFTSFSPFFSFSCFYACDQYFVLQVIKQLDIFF